MSDANHVLGIDGGGSKTLLVVATRDGDVASWRSCGGTNPMDQPAWQARLGELLAGQQPVQAAAVGLAGYDEIPDVSAAQQAAMAALLPGPHSLHNDVQIAFDGAFQAQAGVLILAGTGSMAWAQDGAGGQIRVGGWGHAFGDEGSAYWIGQRALSFTSQTLDGRVRDPAFAEAILAEIGLAADAPHAALLDWHARLDHPRADIAALARCVARLAAQGEAVALGLMRMAADQLCRHVEAARRRIGRPHSRWSHAGGLFAGETLRDILVDRLGVPAAPLLPPIGGALWRAARMAGWPADAAWTQRLAHSLATKVQSI